MASATKKISEGSARDFWALSSAISVFVDVQAAGGVDQQGVVAHRTAFGDRLLHDLERRVGGRLHELDSDLAGEDAELLAGRGPGDVGRHHEGIAAVLRKVLRELRGGGGLAGALKADHHDDGGRPLRFLQTRRGGPEESDHLVANDAHHGLPGRQALQDFLADRFLAHPVEKVLRHLQVHVGLEEGGADVLHGRIDVGLGERAPAAKRPEDALQLVGKRVEHRANRGVYPPGGALWWPAVVYERIKPASSLTSFAATTAVTPSRSEAGRSSTMSAPTTGPLDPMKDANEVAHGQPAGFPVGHPGRERGIEGVEIDADVERPAWNGDGLRIEGGHADHGPPRTSSPARPGGR